MLEGHDISRLRCELAAELAAPRPVLEALVQPRGLLHRSNVRPGLVVAWTVSTMHCIEDAQSRAPRRVQDLQHMRDAVVGFGNLLYAIPELSALGDEVVVRVDHEKCGDRLLVRQCAHDSVSSLTGHIGRYASSVVSARSTLARRFNA